MIYSYSKPLNAEEIAAGKLARLRQITSVADYISRFRRLAYELPRMSQYDKLGHFMRGLKENIRVQVALQDPRTLVQAMEDAETIDRIVFSRDF